MSHTDFRYPQTTSGLTLAANAPWQIRDEDDHDQTLLGLTDLIIETLTKAEALAWVLHSAEDCPRGAGTVTALVIAELIQEALEAQEKQWEKIREIRPKA